MSNITATVVVHDLRYVWWINEDGRLCRHEHSFMGKNPLFALLTQATALAWRQVWIVSDEGDLFTQDEVEHCRLVGFNVSDARGAGVHPHSWLYCFLPGKANSAVEIVQPALDERAPWGEATDARELLLALRAYRKALGFHVNYRRSPGATGTALIRELHTGGRKLSLDAPHAPPPPARKDARGFDAPIDGTLDWIREPTEAERHRAYLHAYDKNGMYLAACAGLDLGYGDVCHLDDTEATAFWQASGGKASGYWRIFCDVGLVDYGDHLPGSDTPALIPGPLYDRRLHYAVTHGKPTPSTVWVSTPMLAYLAPMWAKAHEGEPPIIFEAHVWRNSHQPLQPWYKAMRDARMLLMEQAEMNACPHDATLLALRALKSTYTQTIGWLGGRWEGRDEDNLYRPDWRHAIISQARANSHRTLDKLRMEGTPPFAVGTDCLYILSDERDPVAACPAALKLGTGLGQWKINASASVSEPKIAEALATPLSARLGRLQEALNELGRQK